MEPFTVWEQLPDDLPGLMAFAQRHGSSLILNWGEEGTWEVEWITGGIRFRGAASDAYTALRAAIASGRSFYRIHP